MSDDEVCGGADGIDATARDDFGVEGVAALDAEATSALAALEARLAQKDFIMEPDAIDDVKRYVASGGAPSTAIELLSENYRGYAAMTSLAVHWLRVTAPPKRGANTSPIKVNAALEGRGGAGVTTHTPTGGILTSAAGGSARRVSAGVAQRGDARAEDAPFDELYFLETLVRERFDANKADAVSTQRPVWLDALFKSERGRALLFSLAESNPNCALISLAIQYAWQRGMRHEVRALGPAAAAYFSIFHELLADHIKGIVEAQGDDVRQANMEERVKSMCCQSIGTYVFGQLMLLSLGQDDSETAPVSRTLATRLSEELEAAAARVHGAATVRRLAPWLAASAADATAKYATADLLSSRPVGNAEVGEKVRDTGALAAGDLKKLLDLYVSADDEKKPSVAPLNHPDVLYNLIAEAFKWTVDSKASRSRDECFELIALAVSDESTSADAVKEALRAAVSTVESAKRGESPKKSQMEKAFAVPSAAAGLITAARSALTNESYHRIVQVGNSNEIFLQLLGDIARKHVALQGTVLEALSAIIQCCGRTHGDDLIHPLLDLGCDLVAAGHVIPTLTLACASWSSFLEAPKLRYFANEVLEIAAPPYGRDFAVSMIRLLERSNSRKKMSVVIDEFVEEVRLKRREFSPPLSLSEVNSLDLLSR